MDKLSCPRCAHEVIGSVLTTGSIRIYTRWERFIAWLKRQDLPLIITPATNSFECMKCDYEWGFSNG
jgi:hypothetical protein